MLAGSRKWSNAAFEPRKNDSTKYSNTMVLAVWLSATILLGVAIRDERIAPIARVGECVPRLHVTQGRAPRT